LTVDWAGIRVRDDGPGRIRERKADRRTPGTGAPGNRESRHVASFIERILKTGDKKVLKRLRGFADAINVLEDEFREMSDAELRGETEKFRERIAGGESLDSLLP
jgi:hypothetical protein